MRKLIFATNNQHKVDEIRSIPTKSFEIISLKEAGINIDIPEPHDTLEANATEKSTVIYKLTGIDCLSEDTGLETEALNGEPGVRSARYADDESSDSHNSFEKNIEKLLFKLKGIENRNAQFRTILSLIIEGKEYKFEGICKGTILAYVRGKDGFGYDPVFIPARLTSNFCRNEYGRKEQIQPPQKGS